MPRKSQKPTPSRRNTLLTTYPTLTFALVSAVCILLLYGRTLSNPFVYDDLDQIVHNPNLATFDTLTRRFLLAPVSFSNEFRDVTGPAGSTWRPIFWLSLALDRRLYGPTAPAGFHATNLLLHWLDGLLLFRLLRRLRLHPPLLATIATLLWLILPINSEPVAWVSGRAYLLATFFLLVSLHAARAWLDRPRPLALAAAAIASLAAVLSNEVGLLLLPFTLLLAATLRPTPEREPPSRPNRPQGMSSQSPNRKTLSLRPDYPDVVSSRPKRSGVEGSASLPPPDPEPTTPNHRLALLLATILATDALYLTLHHHIHASAGQGAPTLWAIAPTFWKYIAWILLPVHMSIERSTSTPPNVPSATAALATIALLAFLAAPILLRKRLPATAASLAITALALVPFCGLVPLYQGMAERFTYIASFGVALTVTTLAFSPSAARKRFSLAALALFALWSAVRLHARVDDWSDPATLYGTSLAATPRSPGLYFNLAFTARERGDFQTAAEDYRRATELRPTYQRAWASLGDVYARLGRPADAVQAFEHALTPDDAPTTTSLAVSLGDLGDRPAAEQTFHHALSPSRQPTAPPGPTSPSSSRAKAASTKPSRPGKKPSTSTPPTPPPTSTWPSSSRDAARTTSPSPSTAKSSPSNPTTPTPSSTSATSTRTTKVLATAVTDHPTQAFRPLQAPSSRTTPKTCHPERSAAKSKDPRLPLHLRLHLQLFVSPSSS